MSARFSRLITRMAYGATQLPRIAWYVGHHRALHELSNTRRRQGNQNARHRPVPDCRSRATTRSMRIWRGFFLQDLANVEAGIYPLPTDHEGSLGTILHRSRLFFDDLPAINRRRKHLATTEVLTEKTRGRRPHYYLQNFHFQSGGWMTDESAERYDTQVEVLFNGTANAIRRQALPELHEKFIGHDQRKLSFLDIGCGTGRFIDSLKQVWPRLPTIGLDMSESYIRHAKRQLKRWSWKRFIVGKAEAIPLPDNSQDGVTSIFLLHELPPKIRRVVFNECARVLKPGGRLVIVDSLQRGDRPDYDGLLDFFPRNYHEPYYPSYISADLRGLASNCGMTYIRTNNAFVAKVIVFDKPTTRHLATTTAIATRRHS